MEYVHDAAEPRLKLENALRRVGLAAIPALVVFNLTMARALFAEYRSHRLPALPHHEDIALLTLATLIVLWTLGNVAGGAIVFLTGPFWRGSTRF
jgi:hypothetical protein